MKPIAILPARGGSKRIPRKNIADFCGQPLISYPIEACLAADIFSDVIVSTDDTEIAAIAESYGASSDARPASLGGDTVPAIQVLKELLERRYPNQSYPDDFCLVYPIAAFLTADDITKSFAQLQGYDCVMGVSSFPIHPYKAMAEINGSLAPLWPELNMRQSQNFPEAVASNGTFCWLNTEAFLTNGTLYPERLKGYEIPLERAVDIDTPDDFARAQRLFVHMQNTDR